MGVHFHDSSTGWIVGSGGLIRKTTDGGLTWTTQNSGVTVTLWEVSFHGPDTGYVVGNSGTILKTVDGGANWASDGFGSIQGYYGVHFPASGIGYVVGSTGTILKTTPTTGTRLHFKRPGMTPRSPGYPAHFFFSDALERWFDLRGRGFR
jgi:hypothetical protein